MAHIKVPVDSFYEWYEALLRRSASSVSLSSTFKNEWMKATLLAAFLKGVEATQRCLNQRT